MKTRVFFLGLALILLSLEIRAQSDFLQDWQREIYPEDTTNMIFPEIYTLTCCDSSRCKDNGEFWTSTNYNGDSSTYILAYAQPFYVNSFVAIKSVVFPTCGNWVLSTLNQDTIDSMVSNFFIQVLNEDMDVISQVRYDSLIRNIPFGNTYFYELKFDSLAVVNGRFYIAITHDVVNGASRKLLNFPLNIFALKNNLCDYNEYKYPLAKVKLLNQDNWIYPYEISSTDPVKQLIFEEAINPITTLIILPKIDTSYNDTNNNGVGLLDKGSLRDYINIYPNPAKDNISIESLEIIVKIELINPIGKVLFEKEVNAYNYQINLDSYPTGTYLIKVLTNSGQTTKKVVKE